MTAGTLHTDGREPMMLDELASRFDFVVREHLVIDVPPAAAYDAIEQHRPADLPWGGGAWKLLGTRPGQEVVFSATARFSIPLRHWHEITVEGLTTVWEPHLSQVAMAVSVRPYGTDRSLLSCEARVTLDDPASARWFRVYWRVLTPAAKMLARGMLRAIGETASHHRAG